MNITKIILILLLSTWYAEAQSFCGFYVAKAGAELFNNKSQVILVRDGNKTVVTMSNDFTGNVQDFAMVVPVPVLLKRQDIRITNQSLFDKFDGYSGPRLVEYYDQNPCERRVMYESKAENLMARSPSSSKSDVVEKDKKYKVTIEASYAVGEYDILILSATESTGLKLWLEDNGYKIPEKAERVLEPYIKNKMKFFVVKVNTKAHELQGSQKLRPLQISFESNKFMLPIRLGMANSQGEQDMIVYAFTRNGRVETANYRTLEIPSNRNIPLFVKSKFGQFYSDLFEKSHQVSGENTVFLEYAWNVTPTWGGMKCDPCVGPPPIYQDLADAGVWWIKQNNTNPVFFTRLHVRYAEAQFPEDLFFLTTPNREHFQGRYILRHPAKGNLNCDEGKEYAQNLMLRRNKELGELAALTDWNTSKYTKYVENGSDWIDERKNESPILLPPTGKGPGTGAQPFIRWLLLGIMAFVLFRYVKDLKRMYRPARVS
jgi:hypothetical protein